MVNSEISKLTVWILGLHRSGTTVVWGAFRSNEQFLCYDEPLTDDLGNVFPRNNEKKTYNEYLRIFGSDPARFWALYTAITPLQELDTEFTAEQKAYLAALLQSGKDIVIDETHLHTHLSGIRDISPDSHIIHLHRRARGYVTSHLRPEWSRRGSLSRRLIRRLRHEYDNRVFWTRSDFIPGLRRGDVIGSHTQSKFGLMLAAAGYDAERIMTSTALVRLLAYWHYHYHHIEREGLRIFSGRFRSLRYEDFASRPDETMSDIYAWLGMEPPLGVSYSGVYPPKPPFRVDDRRWVDAAKIAGFSDEEIETLL